VDNRLRTITKNMWNIISTLCKKSGFGWDENLKMITCERNVYDEKVMVCDFFFYYKIYISIEFFFKKIIFFLLTGAS
jgi:hypothetical protein